MTDTQKLWLSAALFGASALLFNVCIERMSLDVKYVAKYPPLIRLFAYTTTTEEDPYPPNYKGIKAACMPGDPWELGCPKKTKVKYVYGLYPTPNINRAFCAIFGLLVPFLSVIGSSYLLSTTKLFTNLITKMGPNKGLNERSSQSNTP